jgi:hypothetical protein
MPFAIWLAIRMMFGMDRAQNLVQQLVRQVQAEAARQGNPQRLLDRDVARQAQIHPATLSAWITGRTRPTQIEGLLSLLDFLSEGLRNQVLGSVLTTKPLKFASQKVKGPKTRRKRRVITLSS